MEMEPTVTKHPLPSAFLQEELSDKPFLSKCLPKLLRRKTYLRLQHPTIPLAISYIPIEETPVSRMKEVFQRCLAVYDHLSIQAPIHIWFVPCKEKRRFPKPHEQVSQRHINGGYTYLSDHSIFIYRLEEFPKVFLHEIIHNSKIHVKQWDPASLQKLYRTFHIHPSTRLEPNEAIIEVWALMFHLSFLSQHQNRPLEELLQEEIQWSLSQAHKLLQHQKDYFPEWKEDTPSFSYIILKTILLLHWDEFSKKRIPYSSKALTAFFVKHRKLPNSPAPLAPLVPLVPQSLATSMRMTRNGDE